MSEPTDQTPPAADPSEKASPDATPSEKISPDTTPSDVSAQNSNSKPRPTVPGLRYPLEKREPKSKRTVPVMFLQKGHGKQYFDSGEWVLSEHLSKDLSKPTVVDHSPRGTVAHGKESPKPSPLSPRE
mmetsp:Transcript_3457/g.10724  ORF Transcript_3457/g.10724 Transcript_3457/m.10724 type:complete len:128 (+) Transcript_3457:261-644(+)